MRRPPSAGMTLFELIIVMAIVAILSAIAIPRFAAAMQNTTLEGAAKRVACDLRLAQANAIKKQGTQAVTIDVAQETYELVGMADPDHRSTTYIINLKDPPYQGVGITSADFGGTATLTFDRFGSPTAPGTIVIEARSRQKTVRVAAGAGRITIE